MRVQLTRDVSLYWNYAVQELKEGTEYIGDLARHLFDNPPAKDSVKVLEADSEPSGPRDPAGQQTPSGGKTDDGDNGDGDGGPKAPADDVPPVDGTIDALMTWVADDPQRAAAALEAEQAKDNPRSTAVRRLAAIADPE